METAENNSKKKKIIIIAVAVLLVAAVIVAFLYFRSQIRATTMRILRIEGEVSLEDNGKNKQIRESMRLSSGNALSTAIKSLVSIGLDDTKIVTLDEMSRAIFNQAGRQLDLELTDGSLFFEVQKPLEDDETMDVRTSTMIVGIRGTSGWVSVEGDHESVIISDGRVHVIGKNPVTGETKEIDVSSGQKVSTYLYNDRSVDSIMFFLEDVTEHDLPEFMLERLREDPELLDKVVTETGWDKPWILGVEVQSLTPVPSVTPEPEVADTTGSDGTDEETPTPTVTPTATPTKEPQAAAEPTQEELEKLLDEMIAADTPTLTPAAPQVVQNEAEPEEEHEDSDKNNSSESTTTPAPTTTSVPTATSTPAPTTTSVPTSTPTPSPSPTSSTPTYSYTPGQGDIFLGSQSPFVFDETAGTLTTFEDASYVDLPVTITYPGGQKTFSSIDDIVINPGSSYTLTSGSITKTADGDYYDSSTNTIKMTGQNRSVNLDPSPIVSSYGLTEKHRDGTDSSINISKLSMINWADSVVSSEATLRDSSQNTLWTVKKTGSDSYEVKDGSGLNTYNYNLAQLNSFISNNNL